MSYLRPFARPLAVLVLLTATSVPAFVALPAAAQSGVEPFVFSNDITEDEDSDEEWQVQVTAQPLDGCVPEHGEPGYATSWLAAGARTGVLLSVGECVFDITATVREVSTDDCLFTAQLSWVHSDGTTTGQFYDSVITSARPRGVSSLSITLAPGRVCNVLNQTHFVIHGTEIVEELPGQSADPDLLALARQAAATRNFQVRIAPDYRSGGVPSSCNRTTHFLVRGDGVSVAQALQPTGASCRFRATVVDAPAPFEIVEGSGESFEGTAANLLVDLSSLVRLRPARIAIIQDVMGSTRRGTVTYTIARSCAGVAVPSTEPVTGRIDLLQGRGTVHSPSYPAAGPTTVYPAVATSTTSTTIVGCSVSVTINGVPEDCVLDGELTRTLTWTAANPIRHFDFEFDITCGVTTPPTTSTEPPTTTTSTTQPPEQAAQPPEQAGGPPADQPTG